MNLRQMLLIAETVPRLTNVPAEPASARIIKLRLPVVKKLQLKPSKKLPIHGQQSPGGLNISHALQLWRQATCLHLVMVNSTFSPGL